MARNISTIVIDAPVERVWKTLTDPALVKQWQYGSELVTSWNVGGEIRFRTEWEGKLFEQWGRILEVKPHTLLRYTLFAPRPDLEDKPDNYFIMNYILTAENGKVKLEILQEDHRPGAKQEDPQDDQNPVLQGLKKIAEAGH